MDPHHPPHFNPFTIFSTSTPFVSAPVFGGPGNQNNHVFQPQLPPQTQTQTPPQASLVPQPPSLNHPPYSEMVCAAIAALNEPDGSSKMAISRYIERMYTGLTPSHGRLLTHHLKTMKNSGVLAMVKKSYKLAASHPLANVVVATAASLQPPRSEIDPMAASGSASQPQKRARGRPPKPKPEGEQPSDVQSNGQNELAIVIKPMEEGEGSGRRRPGRPRKEGSSPIVQAPVMTGGIMKRRGRPLGRRAAGRQRKPKSVASTASVFPYVANGAGRRGRPKRSDTVASEGRELVPFVAPGMKRGRGRPPKIGGVISRRRGRPVGRPRKKPITTQDSGYGELKRKFDLFVEKAKEVFNVLKTEVTSDNQAVMQAMQDLEGLTVIETVEPQAMEDVQPEETATNPEAVVEPVAEVVVEPVAEVVVEAPAEAVAEVVVEAPVEAIVEVVVEAAAEAETHGEEHEQGQEREVGGEQPPTQTEAEAMQEALF